MAIFPRRCTDGQQTHEKMLNIPNDQGNANQNCNEIPPHACQNSYHQKGPEITRRCGEKGTLLHCWRECKLVQPLWKSVWRFLEKVKTELPYNPAISLVGFYTKKIKTVIQKDVCTFMFIAALFTIAKAWKQPMCPSVDEQIKKMWFYIYTHTHTYTHTYI